MQTSIRSCLLNLGLSPKYKGFNYLSSALVITVRDPSALQHVTTAIYPLVGSEYGVSRYAVERCIRTVISNGWRHGNRHFKTFFDLEEGCERPTNAQFLAVVTEYLRLKVLRSSSGVHQ